MLHERNSSTKGAAQGVFLDVSKAFGKVLHEGLFFKLESYGIEGSLLRLLKNYLIVLQQRVVLNGQTSLWQNLTAGVPQGSILEPLLFPTYINYLPGGIASSFKMFADDTSLFSQIENKSCSNFQINKNLKTIIKWAFSGKMLFNPDPINQAIEVFFHINVTRKFTHH